MMNRYSRILLGAVGPSQKAKLKEKIPDILSSGDFQKMHCLETKHAAFYYRNDEEQEGIHPFWISPEKTSGLFWFGEIYDYPGLGNVRDREEYAQSLFLEYRKKGPGFLKQINGAFVLIVWEDARASVLLARDQIGIEQLFVQQAQDGFFFGSNLDLLSGLTSSPPIEPSAFLKYLTFCYNPGEQTFYKGIHRIRPAHSLSWKSGDIKIEPYWHLDFNEKLNASETEIGARIREHLQTAVKIRPRRSGKTGAFLSGGLDSSSIVSLLRKQSPDRIATFSFRCKGESFDESHYAQMVADEFNTEHRLIDYRPEDVLKIEEIVSLMDEPFCDVGINIATYLLAQSAGGTVRDLFTGDGGDELFAGHPVYVADKTARLFRWIPWPFKQLLFFWGRRLPDSEKKKDWKVKVKRFSESYSYPKELGTHRWRAYYTSSGLEKLLAPGFGYSELAGSAFEDAIRYNRECSQSDALSRSLCSDYQTVVQFYLRRLDLVRPFGMTPRLPMLDPNVVSYCAGIPSELKIRGFGDTKYIERTAVEPLLPEAVAHRKDKLGHSIPMKNWMRNHPKVKDFMLDVLSESRIKNRGYFQPDRVRLMIEEHLSSRRNHSHRLWALMVLELWMEKHLRSG
jgi:asparagine synthase (glutamine-hydrolysing)